MLGFLEEIELGQLENSKRCYEDHATHMCDVMQQCDPCDDLDEAALLEDL